MTRDGWSGIDRLLADAFRRVLDAGGWGLVTLHFKRGELMLIETTISAKVAKEDVDDNGMPRDSDFSESGDADA